SQVLDLIERLRSAVNTDPFTGLLADEESSIRCAGLEACYRLALGAPILPLLDDPDPAVRSLAIENAWYTNVFSQAQAKVQAMAEGDPAEEVRTQAHTYLQKVAETAQSASPTTTA